MSDRFYPIEEQRRDEAFAKRTREIEAERETKIAAVRLEIATDQLMDSMEKAGMSTASIRLKRLGLG